MNSLERVLVEHLNARYKPICDLATPPCVTNRFPVIDFDNVKIEFCKSLAQEFKSADGLYIHQAKKKLYFVELKNINLHLQWHGNKKGFLKSFDKFQTIQNANISQKITDSIFVIISTLGKNASHTSDIADILDRRKVKIYYAVVAPMSNRDYILYNIATNLFKPIRHPMLAGSEHEARFISSDEEFDKYVSDNFI